MTVSSFSHLPDDQLMGLCIDREARGEPIPGRLAVGSVILNRVAYGKIHKGWGKVYGNSIKTVILAPAQFSWTINNPLDPNHAGALKIAQNFQGALESKKDFPELESCYVMAQGLISGSLKPITSALFYEAVGTNAKWAKGLTPILTIGRHQFYA